MLMLIAFSCDQHEEITSSKIFISFGISHKDFESGRLNSAEQPAALILSVVTNTGTTVLENKKLSLLQFGQGYVTEGVELLVGSYRITKYLILNASDKVIYATPLEGSDKALLVNDPLPINFIVNSDVTNTVTPEVLNVSSTDTPQLFGYPSFGFSIVENIVTIQMKIKVHLQVGEVLYQDVNSAVKIQGLDSLNNVKWSQNFAYTGPIENELALKPGYHHYTAEINQWGIQDKFTVTHENLISSRADGPSPVTFILGGTTQPKKISSYINYSEVADANNSGTTYLRPDFKVEYEYGFNGKVSKMKFLNYSTETLTFEPLRYFTFTYDGTRVSKIIGYLSPDNTLYIEDNYTYDTNNNVLSIVEKNFGTGITSQVNLTYQYPNNIVRADYTLSNGASFTYEFDYSYKNIVTDMTARFGGTCSEGTYTYDKNINPLRHVGYIDFLLRDFSINNRLTENVNYIACAFPSLIPESYSYEYDVDGYPTTSTKYYKRNSAGGQAVTQTKYFYQ